MTFADTMAQFLNNLVADISEAVLGLVNALVASLESLFNGLNSVEF